MVYTHTAFYDIFISRIRTFTVSDQHQLSVAFWIIAANIGYKKTATKHRI